MFSFTKEELLQSSLNDLMSPLFAQHHDEFILHYLNGGDTSFFQKHHIVFPKNKFDFIFPTILNVRVKDFYKKNY
jgi:hypothetical protein